MTKNKFIIASALFILIAYFLISYFSFRKAITREGNITCPDLSKSVRYTKIFNSSQVYMEFHKFFNPGGSNVISFEQDLLDVRIKWIDNDTLSIYYPQEAKINWKEDSVIFFSDKVYVKYFPE